MQILADENIPLVEAFFGHLGDIRRLPGRQIRRADVGAADVLLVRSVTQVGPELLEGSRVRFVGTCTIGTDHLDLAWLEQAGIHWQNAPGCNARGVVDYILGCLLALAEVTGVALPQRCYGIVGVGQVGSRLAQVLQGLGWSVLLCDPPRQAREGGDFLALDELLERCDVISLHTPLTHSGAWRTQHLLDAKRLARLRPGAWLLNASRGPVVDNRALAEVLAWRSDLEVALDVWEHEPTVDVTLAARCRIATPHIAGYSLDGKMRGTAMIYRALCRFLGYAEAHQLSTLLPPPALQRLSFSREVTAELLLQTLCRAVYDPRRDDADLRRMLSCQPDGQARQAGFDLLRKQYPVRREIDALQVQLEGGSPFLGQQVMALGARLL